MARNPQGTECFVWPSWVRFAQWIRYRIGPVFDGELTSFRFLPSQHETSRRCFGNELAAFVCDFALDIAQTANAPHHFAIGSQESLPYGPKEIDLQFNGGKGFARCECARECHSHCSVSNVTKNAAVQRTHRIGVLWSGFQH